MATKTMNHGDLADGIERLVREYISTVRIAVQGAVERAVAANAGVRTAPNTSAKPRPESATPSRQGPRRPADEIGALSERLYEAVCRTPGEKMTVLAPTIGSRASELNRPMIVLRRAGRIPASERSARRATSRCRGTRSVLRLRPRGRRGRRAMAESRGRATCGSRS